MRRAEDWVRILVLLCAWKLLSRIGSPAVDWDAVDLIFENYFIGGCRGESSRNVDV
jgi:hypothetical protein